MKRILSIQDLSCVGQCSTTVALPLVSACGVECAALAADIVCIAIESTSPDHVYGVSFENAIPALVRALSSMV